MGMTRVELTTDDGKKRLKVNGIDLSRINNEVTIFSYPQYSDVTVSMFIRDPNVQITDGKVEFTFDIGCLDHSLKRALYEALKDEFESD